MFAPKAKCCAGRRLGQFAMLIRPNAKAVQIWKSVCDFRSEIPGADDEANWLCTSKARETRDVAPEHGRMAQESCQNGCLEGSRPIPLDRIPSLNFHAK